MIVKIHIVDLIRLLALVAVIILKRGCGGWVRRSSLSMPSCRSLGEEQLIKVLAALWDSCPVSTPLLLKDRQHRVAADLQYSRLSLTLSLPSLMKIHI